MAFGRDNGIDSGSRADSAPAPHWMRLLEEKYQRLHAKIVNGTSKFTFKRNPSLLSGPALRKAREARRAAKQNDTNAKIVADYADQSGDLEADEVCIDEVNGAERSYRNSDSRANFGDTSYSLNEECQHVAVPGGKQKKVCYEHSRDSTRQQADSNGDCVISNSATPFTSGTVTRIPSSINYTRLSSALEYKEEDDEEYDEVFHQVVNERAAELSSALNNHLQDVANEQDEISLDENEVSKIFEYKNPVIAGEDDDITGDGSIKCHTARDAMEVSRGNRRRRANRQVKTSVSRVSLKTTKSCPANFYDAHDTFNNNHNETQGNATLPIPQSVLPLTSRGVQESRMRVFARMSIEARHAIDEMRAVEEEEKPSVPKLSVRECTEDDTEPWPTANARRDNSVDQLDDMSLQNNASGVNGERVADGDGRYDVDSVGAESEMSIPSNNDNANRLAVTNQRSNTRVSSIPHHSRDDITNNNYSVTLHTSNRRHGDSMSKTSTYRKLPQMQHPDISLSQTFPNPHSRLPDIGQSFLSFRENTFEITPPDFDIRFHQIIPLSRGDRDTPPLDVRQHSIEKCEQWLVRHTPRR